MMTTPRAADVFTRRTLSDAFSLILSIGVIHRRRWRILHPLVSACLEMRPPTPLADAFGASR